uniref:Fe2OG dioxygenase domain-containing protein n=1 Tax=Ditylum brightwellii TaxID=49249 RepID=A0A6S9AB29_9STRA|mmetsp:Transcript_8776/g.12783  ORF Transcript_8776/g.12783 Transcript_8776/m.12783 type:complete len:335 (-) Transcript_8776:258-1262(-)
MFAKVRGNTKVTTMFDRCLSLYAAGPRNIQSMASTTTMINSPAVAIASINNICKRLHSTMVDPIIDMQQLQNKLVELSPDIATSLTERGYYTTSSILPSNIIRTMRSQSINLRHQGRFEQSWSERIDSSTGSVVRFDKEGVFACEPDGRDYDVAPDLIVYMSVLLQTLPTVLCEQSLPTSEVQLSNQSFNAKLAVTSPGGSVYPLHIDNPQGVSAGDTRKLTCILYLNPDYEPDDGGEIRLYLDGGKKKEGKTMKEKTDKEDLDILDLTPVGGRLLAFWSDEIPHEVLATAPMADGKDEKFDRYALTIWIPTENYLSLHNYSSKFSHLRDLAFP